MPSSDWIIRNCPGCNSSRFNPLPEVVSQKRAEYSSFEEVKEYFVGLRSEQVFFSYHRCLDCGLLYCPRYFSNHQLDILYSVMPDNLMGEDKSTISKTQSGYVNWTSKYLATVKRYLEIGPDIGLITREVVRRYCPEQVSLIEPNKAIRSALSESAQGVEYVEIVDDLRDIREHDFDLIAGVHVYDHLLDPVGELRKMYSIASPQSALMLVVHNEKSLLRKILGRKWPPFCLQHPQLYNPQTLQHVLNHAGWHLQEVSKSTNWWHLDHFAEMGSGVMGLPTKWTKLLPSVELPTRLGNMIALARRG